MQPHRYLCRFFISLVPLLIIGCASKYSSDIETNTRSLYKDSSTYVAQLKYPPSKPVSYNDYYATAFAELNLIKLDANVIGDKAVKQNETHLEDKILDLSPDSIKEYGKKSADDALGEIMNSCNLILRSEAAQKNVSSSNGNSSPSGNNNGGSPGSTKPQSN